MNHSLALFSTCAAFNLHVHRVMYELRSSSGMRWRLALPLDDWLGPRRQRPVRPQDPARTPKTWRDPHGAHELADRARGPLPAVNRGDWPGTAPREELMAGDARLGRCRRHSFIPGSGGPRALLDAGGPHVPSGSFSLSGQQQQQIRSAGEVTPRHLLFGFSSQLRVGFAAKISPASVRSDVDLQREHGEFGDTDRYSY